jgi:hypothetical protein
VFERRQGQKADSVSEQFKLLLDPAERERFKDAQPGLRHIENGHVQLMAPEHAETLLRRYAERRSYRKFVKQAITLKQVSELLGYLRQICGGPRAVCTRYRLIFM